jgi:hypothetical protein
MQKNMHADVSDMRVYFFFINMAASNAAKSQEKISFILDPDARLCTANDREEKTQLG